MTIKSKQDADHEAARSTALIERRRQKKRAGEPLREEGAPQARSNERDAEPAPGDQPDALAGETWRIPAPASGGLYTQTELAGLLGVKVCTVRDWVARGNRGERLHALRVPRGRITPAEVRRFLEAVNGVPVALER